MIKVGAEGYVRFNTEPSTYYQATDFFIGARVKINKHDFVVVDADEYAYNYMELHRNEVFYYLLNIFYIFLFIEYIILYIQCS